MDVQCFIDGEEEVQQPVATTSAEGTQGSPPGGSQGPFEQLLATALLISPFFFWGTSMVAMKVSPLRLILFNWGGHSKVQLADSAQAPGLCMPGIHDEPACQWCFMVVLKGIPVFHWGVKIWLGVK